MNQKVFEKFPQFETKRLLLSEIKKEDAHIILEGNSNFNYLKYIARDPFKSIEEAEKKVEDYIKWFEGKICVMFKFTSKENSEPIGYGGLFNISPSGNKGEIGYIILGKRFCI